MTEPEQNKQFSQQIYRQLDDRIQGTAMLYSASGVHGFMMALACGGMTSARLMSRRDVLGALSDEDFALIEGIFGLVERDLIGEELQFQLLLPGEDNPMADRVDALRDWCQGFVDGLGTEMGAKLTAASAECHEAIRDIQQISEMVAPQEPDESTERDLFEVEEFVRVASLMIFEELAPPPADLSTSANVNH